MTHGITLRIANIDQHRRAPRAVSLDTPLLQRDTFKLFRMNRLFHYCR